MEIEALYRIYQTSLDVCTDTRSIRPNSLFFALKGDNFNGNKFASMALDQGAQVAVVDEFVHDPRSGQIILVENVLQTLQDLARYHRSQFHIPFLGITGSNGKTTTKELLYAVLSQKYRCQATHGNLNNHIGVPLTVLGIRPDTEFAIIEMGANHLHEIELLCTVCQPTSGIITNVGLAHLEGFGGFEGVKKGKKELYDYLRIHQGQVFLKSANADLAEMSLGLPHPFYYGSGHDDMIQGRVIKADPYLWLEWRVRGSENYHLLQTNLTGVYNFENVLASIAAAWFYGLDAEQINQGITGYTPANNRSQRYKSSRNELILDLYNANPSSMKAALENFTQLKAGHKLVILGDMFELGEQCIAEHTSLLEQLAEAAPDQIILIGPVFSGLAALLPQARVFGTTAAAAAYLQAHEISGALILLKGSRGMKLESLVACL